MNKNLKLLLLLLLCTAFAACNQYSGETPSDRTTSDIEVHWTPALKISDVCHAMGISGDDILNGCARSKPGNALVCEIYAVEPKSFSDSAALKVLGHETWHCFGAKHPEQRTQGAST